MPRHPFDDCIMIGSESLVTEDYSWRPPARFQHNEIFSGNIQSISAPFNFAISGGVSVLLEVSHGKPVDVDDDVGRQYGQRNQEAEVVVVLEEVNRWVASVRQHFRDERCVDKHYSNGCKEPSDDQSVEFNIGGHR